MLPISPLQGGQTLQQGFSMPVSVPVNSSSSSSTYQPDPAHSPRPPSSSLMELQQQGSYPPSSVSPGSVSSPKRGASPPRNSLRVLIPTGGGAAGISEPELSVVSVLFFL